jgi:hypothetical protein
VQLNQANSQLTTEFRPPPFGHQPAPSSDNQGAKQSQIDIVPPGYPSIHAALPNAQFFHLDAYSMDRQLEKDCNPDMLTDEGTSTGYYTIYCMLMQLTSMLQITAAY